MFLNLWVLFGMGETKMHIFLSNQKCGGKAGSTKQQIATSTSIWKLSMALGRELQKWRPVFRHLFGYPHIHGMAWLYNN